MNKLRTFTWVATMAVGGLAVGACTNEPSSPIAAPPAWFGTGAPPGGSSRTSAVVVVPAANLLPEGIEYDPRADRFLVGSMSKGTVFEVAPDGTLIERIVDPDLKVSVGLEVDLPRKRLLVAGADYSPLQEVAPGWAQLGIYELEAGRRLAMMNLAASRPEATSFFANDIAVASDGSAFVTDSAAAIVYKVDPQYRSTVFWWKWNCFPRQFSRSG